MAALFKRGGELDTDVPDAGDAGLAMRFTPGWVDTHPGSAHRPIGAGAFGDRARIADAVRYATANGREEGHRQGYVEGFGWGAWCGIVAGALLAILARMVWDFARANGVF